MSWSRAGRITEIATGEKNGPWTGVTFYKGFFYVAEGGELLDIFGGDAVDPELDEAAHRADPVAAVGHLADIGHVDAEDSRLDEIVDRALTRLRTTTVAR